MYKKREKFSGDFPFLLEVLSKVKKQTKIIVSLISIPQHYNLAVDYLFDHKNRVWDFAWSSWI